MRIEEVLHPVNLMRAYHQVIRNKGAAGVDRMEVDVIKEEIRRIGFTAIKKNTYFFLQIE